VGYAFVIMLMDAKVYNARLYHLWHCYYCAAGLSIGTEIAGSVMVPDRGFAIQPAGFAKLPPASLCEISQLIRNRL
jgi:hypothetical protein